MKRLVVALAALSLAAPVGAGAAPAGCPMTTVVLNGIVAASPGVDFSLPYGLLVDVTSANAAGHAYLKAPQPVTVIVFPSTAVSGDGAHTIAAFNWSDGVRVAARVCGSKLAHRATPVLNATRVTAAPRHP